VQRGPKKTISEFHPGFLFLWLGVKGKIEDLDSIKDLGKKVVRAILLGKGIFHDLRSSV